MTTSVVQTVFFDLGDTLGSAQLDAVRTALDTDHALVTLRARAAASLPALPRPLGFGRHVPVRSARPPRRQHRMGADPEPSSG